jgi:hypothetical protein
MPMGLAWFVALFSWGLAALQITCVVLARRRRPWTRVVLVVCLTFVACSMLFAFLASLAFGAPSPVVLLLFGIDGAALWVLLSGSTRS